MGTVRAFLRWFRPKLPPVVVAVLLVGLSVLALALGADAKLVATALIGLAVAASSQRLGQLTAQRPALNVAARVGHAHATQLRQEIPAPWPLDAELIVWRAVRESRQLNAPTRARLARLGHPTALRSHGFGYAGPEQRERAREAYVADLDEYERELGDWLSRYGQLADERWRTFPLELIVSNGKRAADVDSCEIELQLPPGVEVVDEPSAAEAPPAEPRYVVPANTVALGPHIEHARLAALRRRVPVMLDPIPLVRDPSAVRVSPDGRKVTIKLKNLHHGRENALDDVIFVRVPHAETFELPWTAYVSGGSRHQNSGVLTLTLPAPVRDRPAFGTLSAVLAWPDVAIDAPDELDDGVVTDHRGPFAPREVDPPVRPPACEVKAEADGLDDDKLAGLGRRLRAQRVDLAWQRLGYPGTTFEGEAEDPQFPATRRASLPAG